MVKNWTDKTSDWHQTLMPLIKHNPLLNNNDALQKINKGLGLINLSLLMVQVAKLVLNESQG